MYDKDTKEYLGSDEAMVNPRNQLEWIMPENSTEFIPQYPTIAGRELLKAQNKTQVFNGSSGWMQLPDFRSVNLYAKSNGALIQDIQIGDTPESLGAVDVEPDIEADYITWDNNTSKWVEDAAAQQAAVDAAAAEEEAFKQKVLSAVGGGGGTSIQKTFCELVNEARCKITVEGIPLDEFQRILDDSILSTDWQQNPGTWYSPYTNMLGSLLAHRGIIADNLKTNVGAIWESMSQYIEPNVKAKIETEKTLLHRKIAAAIGQYTVNIEVDGMPESDALTALEAALSAIGSVTIPFSISY